MKIVHLTASRFFGGPERQMLGLAQHLPAEFRSAFVSFSEGGRCHPFLDEVRRAGFDGIALRHDTPRLLAALNELTGVLRRFRAHVLVPHGYKSNIVGLAAARRIGIPVVSVSHGWTGESYRVRLYEWLDRQFLRRMDAVVCVSDAQREKVGHVGVSGSKIAVIRDAVSCDTVMVIRKAIDPGCFSASGDPAYRNRLLGMFAQSPDVIVGAAGRLSREKGFDLLIDAAAQVLACPATAAERLTPTENRPHIGFVLFGDGRLRVSLASQIAALGLEGRFVLGGFHSDLRKYYPHLDLFVQSSYTEGLPNVVLEACASGVPVVATAVGGTPEIIADGVTGRLVPPGDAGALARAIADMLSNLALCRAMGERGQRVVREQFSFAAQARQYRELLATLMSQHA